MMRENSFERGRERERRERDEEVQKNVDDSGGAHCICSANVVNSFVRSQRSLWKVRVRKKVRERTERKRKSYHKGSRDDGDGDGDVDRLWRRCFLLFRCRRC